MKEMQNNNNGGAQKIVIQKYFLRVNNFKHVDILYVQKGGVG